MTIVTRERLMAMRSSSLKHPAQRCRSAEREVLELLRQARMHVVEMRNAERRRNHHADRGALFVRVHGVVSILDARDSAP